MSSGQVGRACTNARVQGGLDPGFTPEQGIRAKKTDLSVRISMARTASRPARPPTKSIEFTTSEAEQRIVEQVGFVPLK
jgi:hypothetical protein